MSILPSFDVVLAARVRNIVSTLVCCCAKSWICFFFFARDLPDSYFVNNLDRGETKVSTPDCYSRAAICLFFFFQGVSRDLLSEVVIGNKGAQEHGEKTGHANFDTFR